MLAVGLAMFAFRYAIPASKWPEKCARLSFWCMNIGLAWMVFATLLPLGVLQLYHSVSKGYFEARSLGYITRPGNSVIEWLRLPGDLLLILGGVLLFVWIAWTAIRNVRSAPASDELLEHPLYTEFDSTPAASHKDRR
jgi:nitric oxide reductase subunit B